MKLLRAETMMFIFSYGSEWKEVDKKEREEK